MGVFADKKFEELDWISQTTEPIDSKLNEILGLIPEETTIDFTLFKELMGDGFGTDIDLSRAISYMVHKYANQDISWDDRRVIEPCFEFSVRLEPPTIINFEEGIVDGEIKLIKIQSTLEEKVLETLLGQNGINKVRSMYINNSGLSRANDVMEILGNCEKGLKTRSHRGKIRILHFRLTEIFKHNEWNIKDTELANKVGYWIASYVQDGDLSAWSNVCRLKVMTHKGLPIYSMEEVE